MPLHPRSDLPDLYPGFAEHWIETSIGKIYARSGGSGEPVLLLHGYAETNVMWHSVAPALAEQFSLIIPDLPGYGWSDAPPADEQHRPYTKRVMANVMLEVMASFGHEHFRLAGHDRGGRVGYRLALDHPDRLVQLAVLDLIPIAATWDAMDADLAYAIWNWLFLALPHPVPENMIYPDAIQYWTYKTAQNTKTHDLSAFDPRAIAHYHAFIKQYPRIVATCEDYRAGHTTDWQHDIVDQQAGTKIRCPVHVLCGSAGKAKQCASSPLSVWAEWADEVSGTEIDSGHFLAEENPSATAAALLEFMA